MNDTSSHVSTTTAVSTVTRLALGAGAHARTPRRHTAAVPAAAAAAAAVGAGAGGGGGTAADYIETMQAHIALQTKYIAQLETQLERAREACRAASALKLICYREQESREVTVAVVTGGTPDGINVFQRTQAAFMQRKSELMRRGVSFFLFEDVPLNRVQELPFGSKPPG